MAKLSVFCFLTLNGLYKGAGEDISWHQFGEDEQLLSDKLSNCGNTLLFGRVTYEMMAKHWSSDEAMKLDSVTAKGMNQSKKVVFSKTLDQALWQNTTLVKSNILEFVRNLKCDSVADLTILGSGQIVTQLTEAGLIDNYTFLINPLALGTGTSMFSGISRKLTLHLDSSVKMKSGNILLSYSSPN